MIISAEVFLNSLGKFPAGKQDPVFTGLAFQTNIGTQPHNLPDQSSTGMWFP
jgi:hypothetical protein